MIAGLRRAFLEERTATLLGLTRALVAALITWQTAKLALRLRNGYFADYFHLPIVPEAWVPSQPVYAALLAIKLVACLLALAGAAPRASLLVVSAIGLYGIACDRLQYHNNHYLAHLVAFLLAFTPCHRSFLPIQRLLKNNDRRRAGAEPRGVLWAVVLIKIQVALVYLTSGASKLFDPDWFGGEVMRLRYLQGPAVLRARGYDVPQAVDALLGAPWFASFTSKGAIVTELFLTVGLLLPRTRVPALWFGVLFHVGIQIFAWVDLFSWLMLSLYVLYATPETRERTLYFDPALPGPRRVAALVRASDWLLRYRLVAARSDTAPALALCVVDRDGNLVSGRGIWILLCRTLPLLFPLWLPSRMIRGAAEPRAREIERVIPHN